MLKEDELLVEIDGVQKWIKEYVKNAGVKGVVVGDSGGKDSATVIALCAKALGSENVIAVSMPCNSIQTDYDDAKLVADTYGVKFIKVDLTNTYNEMEREINQAISTKLINESKINIKPRLRMTTLYGIAQTMNCLVVGTGNMCEIAVRIYNQMGR
ncbi:MAG: NAD(+) synthase [Clostridia bacterium]|nr:NAD(+) synthase [Clostridia bacterium]